MSAFVQFRCLLAGAALVAGLLGSAGCSDEGGDDAVPLTTTSRADATTTSDATTTTVDFETEVKRAAIELLELRNEVFMNPDPARVSEYISETCVCREIERRSIDDLVANGANWAQPPFEVLGIRVSDADPAEPALIVVARQPGGSIVSASSTTTVAEVALAPLFVTLVPLGADWRLNALDEFPLNDAAAREIVAEGLP